MPSSALLEISNQIEAQDTDAFGKFYLYAGLLNVICISKQAFDKVMPEQEMGLGMFGQKSVNTGVLSGRFFSQITAYQKDFEVQVPNPFSVVQKIFLAYIGKGQLRDLAFIMDKMLGQLLAITADSTTKNGSIYSAYTGINFEKHRVEMMDLLIAVNDITYHNFATVENGVHATLSAVLALISLMVILMGTLSFASTLLGLALAGAGAFGAYVFCEKAIASSKEMEKAYRTVEDLSKTMTRKITDGTFAKNDYRFIIASVLKPLAFAEVTIREQLAMDQDDLDGCVSMRQETSGTFEKIENACQFMPK